MAWQLLKTMELMQSLQGMTDKGNWHKKGAKDAGKQAGSARGKKFCPWQGCDAAEGKKPTLGDKRECFCRGKHFSFTPPIEMLVQWAYEDKINASGISDTDAKPAKGKGKGKGKAKAAAPSSGPTSQTNEQLAAVRQERLAALRDAKTRAATANQGKAAGHPPQILPLCSRVRRRWQLRGKLPCLSQWLRRMRENG